MPPTNHARTRARTHARIHVWVVGMLVFVLLPKPTNQPTNQPTIITHDRYAPPPVWTAENRSTLANSILVEFTNTFDLWYADPTPAGDGGPMAIPGGLLTNIDSVVQLTHMNYSVPGSMNDADMLQVFCGVCVGYCRVYVGCCCMHVCVCVCCCCLQPCA